MVAIGGIRHWRIMVEWDRSKESRGRGRWGGGRGYWLSDLSDDLNDGNERVVLECLSIGTLEYWNVQVPPERHRRT